MNYPILVRLETAGSQPHLKRPSCAEAVVTALYHGRDQHWFDLLGFAVLPTSLYMIIVPRSQSLVSIVLNLQAELGPLLNALLNTNDSIWQAEFEIAPIASDDELRPRIEEIHDLPVKAGLANDPTSYPFSSANPRFKTDLGRYIR